MIDEECVQGEGSLYRVLVHSVHPPETTNAFLHRAVNTTKDSWLLLWLTLFEFKKAIQMRTLWPISNPSDTKVPPHSSVL